MVVEDEATVAVDVTVAVETAVETAVVVVTDGGKVTRYATPAATMRIKTTPTTTTNLDTARLRQTFNLGSGSDRWRLLKYSLFRMDSLRPPPQLCPPPSHGNPRLGLVVHHLWVRATS